MNPADIEKKRLEILYSFNVLHSQKEERYERITKVACQIFNLPIAGITLVDSDVVWFKSIQGVGVAQVPRSNSFSEISKLDEGPVIVEDVLKGAGYSQNVLVQDYKIGAYAGCPIIVEKCHIGEFFIADYEARKFTELQILILKELTAWVVDELLHGKMLLEEQKMRNDLVSRNQELVREKARADAMLSDIGDGVIGINDRGEIIFVNPQVEVMTGYKAKDLMGKLLIQTVKMFDINEKQIEALNQPIRQALFYKKKVISEEYLYERSDHTKFPAAITATPIVVFDQVIGGVVVFRDITREKEIDRMKTEFISLASHQLRTPLSAMKWFSEILLDGDAGELSVEQKELMNNIYKSNERMIELVNTLLNISRIESGRIMIDPKPTDMRKLLEEILLEVRPKLDQKKQKVAVSVHQNLPLVVLDPKLIRHVYLNLLTNAIKYTPLGGDIIVVVSRKGDQIVSQVSDTGLGIPKEQQDRVFKKFFRAENVIKVETEGTGLGLYLAKAIVESSGGKIWFNSIQNSGTTFWFSLPFVTLKREGVVSIDS